MNRPAASHRRMLFLARLLLPTLAWPAVSRAIPPSPGDFVLVTWRSETSACCEVVVLDATTFTSTVLSSAGYLDDPQDLAVGPGGDIFVTVPTVGIVRVDASSGSQAVFTSVAALGGRAPHGIVSIPGGLYVSVRGHTAGVLQLGPDGTPTRVVSTGGFLQLPAGLAVGPGGEIYACETVPDGSTSSGGLIRIDPLSGAQTLVASGEPLHGPFDVAIAPDGSLWSVQRSRRLHGRRGALARTSALDGATEPLPTSFDVAGIAIRPDGLALLAECAPVHGDCSSARTILYPDGPTLAPGRDGPLAVVPDAATRMLTRSWGRLKLVYR